MKIIKLLTVLSLIIFASCKNEKMPVKNSNIEPPVAKKIPETLSIHNHTRIDHYYWLNDRDNKDVIAYIEEENHYYKESTAHLTDFTKNLFEEMKARIKEDDQSVPYKNNGYWYITKYEKGKDYPIYTRKKGDLNAEEELLFDCNEMAKDYDFFNFGGFSVSPDNEKISYSFDTVGRNNFTLQMKNLKTNEVYPEKIENITAGSTWANDNKTLFYVRKDEQTLRSNRIFKHILNSDTKNDQLVFEEEDETYSTFIYKSKSKAYLIIGSYSTLSQEYRILDANTPNGVFKVFQPRIRGLEYEIAHYKDHFYVVTNADDATNFKLIKTSINNTSKENWEEVIAHREDVLLEGIDIFKDYLVVSERANGLKKIRIKRWDNSADYFLPFNNETYTAYPTTNIEFDTPILRYSYNDLTTPASVIDFNMDTKEKTILKEQEVLGGQFNKDNYESKRIWATAKDGTKIPISLVYKKGIKLDGNNPLLQYAYGSYGATMNPYFSSIRLSLLDRGFIYAIAHIRGGQYLGRQWYEDGKLFNKKNTFTDFIACSEFLISEKYTSPKHLYAMGGSAGGLLMGAVVNMAPELYNGVVAAVPFVDVVTTMLDDSIPLTTSEYDEWGNPNENDYYNYMLSYSPYDNIEAKAYPNLLVTSGLHDSQVQYWEPTKWVAKLRDLKTDDHIIYLDTNMKAGHSGASGRFERIKEVAKQYAFILNLEGILN